MSQATGLLVRLDESRRADLIREKPIEKEGFTDTLSLPDWPFSELSVALLGFGESTIDYICLARKGRLVATLKNHVEFFDILSLDAVEIGAIERKVSQRLRHYFVNVSAGTGGVVPAATWSQVIDAVKAERPWLTTEIDHLLDLQHFSGTRWVGKVATLLSEERDALGISLDIFSHTGTLRSRVLSSWVPRDVAIQSSDEQTETAEISTDYRRCFLSGISPEYVSEEAAIQHDFFNWPGMSAKHIAGQSVFEQGRRRLEVTYANRNPLEATFGVDLVYYSSCFQSFVFVQYKLMRIENKQVVYRPDSQLEAELKRMDDCYKSLHTAIGIRSHEDYRFSDDGFLLKFVPASDLQPASRELIKGMYVPREYMHFLLGPNGPKGPRGGPRITLDNVPRYLTNSEFSTNVAKGWIGTRAVQREEVRNMVQRSYETRRAVMVASESKTLVNRT